MPLSLVEFRMEATKLLNPCSSEAVRLGLKKMGRETSGARTRLTLWGGRRPKNLSRAPEEACVLIESVQCFV